MCSWIKSRWGKWSRGVAFCAAFSLWGSKQRQAKPGHTLLLPLTRAGLLSANFPHPVDIYEYYYRKKNSHNFPPFILKRLVFSPFVWYPSTKGHQLRSSLSSELLWSSAFATSSNGAIFAWRVFHHSLEYVRSSCFLLPCHLLCTHAQALITLDLNYLPYIIWAPEE